MTRSMNFLQYGHFGIWYSSSSWNNIRSTHWVHIQCPQDRQQLISRSRQIWQSNLRPAYSAINCTNFCIIFLHNAKKRSYGCCTVAFKKFERPFTIHGSSALTTSLRSRTSRHSPMRAARHSMAVGRLYGDSRAYEISDFRGFRGFQAARWQCGEAFHEILGSRNTHKFFWTQRYSNCSFTCP